MRWLVFAAVLSLGSLTALGQTVPGAPSNAVKPPSSEPQSENTQQNIDRYSGTNPTAPAPDTVSRPQQLLHPADVGRLFPPEVYFQQKTAAIQARNSAGVRWGDGRVTMAALVDTSGYASTVQQKYQAYLITEVALEINKKLLPAGVYGIGFEDGGGFVVMDVGGNDIFTVEYTRDTEIARPMPLQLVTDAKTGGYRFYEGRNFVYLNRAGHP